MSDTESPQAWWIATAPLTQGGEKILGPFATQELALEVRRYVEIAEAPRTFWVDQDEAAEAADPAAGKPTAFTHFPPDSGMDDQAAEDNGIVG